MGLSLLSEITSAMPAIPNPEYRAEVYLAIANQFNQNAAREDAVEYIEQAIHALAHLPKDLSTFWEHKVVKQLVKAGQQSQAEKLLAELLDRARANENLENRSHDLLDVSTTYVEIGLFDEAVQVAQTIEDEYQRVFRAFDEIVDCAIKNSEYQQVEDLLALVDPEWEQGVVLQEAAAAYAFYGQPERAFSLVQQISFPNGRYHTLRNIFLPRQKQSRDDLLCLLQEGEVYVASEIHLGVKAQALRIMSQPRMRLNQFDHASSLLEEARQLAEGMSLDEPGKAVCREVVLNDIANAWGELNRHMTHQSDDRAAAERTQKAETIGEALANNNAHIANLQRVLQVQSWVQQGSIEEALAIAEQITEAYLKDLALRLAGVSPKAEYLDDVVKDLQKVCVSASQQDDADTGLAILQQVMAQLPALENCITRPTVDLSKDFRSAYKASLLVSVVEAYFQLANTDV